MNKDNINAMISEALAIEKQSAIEAGTVSYMARAMVQATMPHKKTTEQSHIRKNGTYKLIMTAVDPEIGLPYGALPRLMLAFIGAEVMRTGEREIVLGNSMSSFMRELGLVPTGGRWGSVTRLKDQSKRLFSCSIRLHDDAPDHFSGKTFDIGEPSLWWHTQTPEQLGIFQSTVKLSEQFYNEITEHPVPLDMRVLKLLKQSPMALDVYAWTTYRIFTLNRSKRPDVVIPWEALQLQFGAGYSTKTSRGRADFKKKFLLAMRKVQLCYPEAKIADVDNGLLLKKSPLHIPSRPEKSTA